MQITSKVSPAFLKMCLVLWLAAPSAAMAQKQDMTRFAPALKELQATWHRAYVVSDSAKLMTLLSPEVRIVRSSGITLKKSQALNHYRTRDTAGLKISTVDQEVKADGGLAVITCRVKERDKGVPYVYYVTDVMQRKKSTWQIIHSQWNILPGQWDKVIFDSAVFSGYTGTYVADDGKIFTVETKENQLLLRNTRGRLTIFFPRSRTQFFKQGEPDEIVFVKAASEAQPSILLYISGLHSYVYHRKK